MRVKIHQPPAALLLTVWVITPLLSLIHGATEAHRYCVEHGRFEEAAHTHERAPLSEHVDADADPLVVEGHSEESPIGHEACIFSGDCTRESLCLLAGTVAIDLAVTRIAISGFGATSVEIGISPLFFAPKSSPPLAV